MLGEFGQRHVAERRHNEAFRLRRLAQAKFDIVREQPPHAADPLLERHDLELELDLVLAVDVRPYVDRLGRLHIVAAVLEDDLRIADRESVLVGDAPAHDEGVVVEVEATGIEEQHLAYLGPLLRFRRVTVTDAGRLRGALHDAGIFLEDVGRGEAVGLQDQLALQVAELVAAAAVGVFTAVLLGKPSLQHRFFGVECHERSLTAPYPAATVLSSRGRGIDLAERFRPFRRRSRRNNARRATTARGSRSP